MISSENAALVTIAATVASGVLALALSQKTAIPSILFYLVFGVTLGPSVANIVQPSVFSNFPQYVSLLVALILFEGGASLKTGQYRDISRDLRRILTLGTVLTLAGGALAAHHLAGLPWPPALLLGSILIVTGPTVVIPILQRLRVKDNIHNLLKWESILIDPIGVVTAVVLFEFLAHPDVGLAASLAGFLLRFGIGIAFGLAGGWVSRQLLVRRHLFRFEGEELGSLLVVGVVFLFYGASEVVASHAGLVTAPVIGLYLGNRAFAYQEQILRFERNLTHFALAVLFILLSAQIPVASLREIAPAGFALLVVLIFVVRPASVLISTAGKSGLTLREKMFVSAFAPRGIVSATLTTLFALSFSGMGWAGGDKFLALGFFVIVGSIIFYAGTGPLVTWLLGIREAAPNGFLIVGATPLGIALADELRRRNRPVQFIDTNPSHCWEAHRRGFEAWQGSGFDIDFLESLDRKGIGAMIALTPSHEVNLLSCQAQARFLGADRVYRIWDTADTWDNLRSPAYDQSLGRPLLATLGAGADRARALQEGAITLRTEPIKENIRVQPETFASGQLSGPLFAWTPNGPIFATPDAVLPAGAELVSATTS